MPLHSRVMLIIGYGIACISSITFGQPASSDKQSVIAEQRCMMMGTNVSIKVQTEESELDKAHAAIEKAVARMQNLIDVVNARDINSEVSYLNQNAGKEPVHIHTELMQILKTSRDVSVASEGAFDVTFYAVGQLWKLRPVLPEIPTDEAITSALLCVGYQKLVLDPEAMTAFLNKEGMRIELGAIAKGAVVDKAAQSLLDDGFSNYLINAGGDLYVTCPTESPGWKVGLTNPVDPRGPVLGTIEMHRGSIVTSGNYEKMVEINGKRYHHIIDPRTGRPADRCISVTVIADNAMLADAYATAFFVMGPEKGMKLCESLPDIEAFFIDKDMKTSCSSGFPVKELLDVEIKKD